MTTYFLGMTSTLKALLLSQISVDALGSAEFIFSCSKAHVLDPGGQVPKEATWCNNERIGERDPDPDKLDRRARKYPLQFDQIVDRYGLVDIEKVDPDFRELVWRFLEIIALADLQGRVAWQAGHPLSVLPDIDEDDSVIYNGTLQRVNQETGELESVATLPMAATSAEDRVEACVDQVLCCLHAEHGMTPEDMQVLKKFMMGMVPEEFQKFLANLRRAGVSEQVAYETPNCKLIDQLVVTL